MVSNFMKYIAILLLILAPSAFAADEKKDAQPPALVSVADVRSGMAEPVAEYVGTILYTQQAKVAAEASGKVVRVNYDEGQRVKAGFVLVELGDEMIEAAMSATRAQYEQALVELDQAKKDLKRIEALFSEDSVSEVVRDEHGFRVMGLEKKAQGLRAQLEGLEIEKGNKSIEAPFDGIVVEKTVEAGEWVNVGGTIAVLAGDSVEASVNVPEETLSLLKKGRAIEVRVGGKSITGRFKGFVPKGDISTRTFPAKVVIENGGDYVEGMEARVMMPSGPKRSGLLVMRDAVINKFGADVIFVVTDEGMAKMIPVKITGYDGLMASISGPGLSEGMKAVIKGNERIRDGQPVKIAQ